MYMCFEVFLEIGITEMMYIIVSHIHERELLNTFLFSIDFTFIVYFDLFFASRNLLDVLPLVPEGWVVFSPFNF